MTYINGIDNEKKDGCFFCDAWAETGRERENLVLGRGRGAFIMMNRFPYSNAHLLIAPTRHIGVMEEASDEEGAELWRLTTLAKRALSNAFSPSGFNVVPE